MAALKSLPLLIVLCCQAGGEAPKTDVVSGSTIPYQHARPLKAFGSTRGLEQKRNDHRHEDRSVLSNFSRTATGYLVEEEDLRVSEGGRGSVVAGEGGREEAAGNATWDSAASLLGGEYGEEEREGEGGGRYGSLWWEYEHQLSFPQTEFEEVMSPHLTSTLHNATYMVGCEATMYHCGDNGFVSELRYSSKDVAYRVKSRDSEGGGALTCRQPQPVQEGKKGKKRLAILTHSYLACTQRWHEIATMLAQQGFMVVTPLLAGHGIDSSSVASYSELEYVPKDVDHSSSDGYTMVARSIADMAVDALKTLEVDELVIGGFSAGGAVVLEALTILTSYVTDGLLTERDFKKIRMVHVATFLDTPKIHARLARDVAPLLWVNKFRLNGNWFDTEWSSGHPLQWFAAKGRRGYLNSSRSTEMRLLRYVTKVKAALLDINFTSLSKRHRRGARLVKEVPVLGVVLMNDGTVENELTMNVLASKHRNIQICGLRSNHDDLCGTCCDEDHCEEVDGYGGGTHTPDCHAVDEQTDLNHEDFHFCGGSGRQEHYPDGLVHDTLLDSHSRAGKETGWWVNCVESVITRFAMADQEALMGAGQMGSVVPCAVDDGCDSMRRLVKVGGGRWHMDE